MPGTRARRARNAGRDEALSASWMASLDQGTSPDELLEQMLALSPLAAEAGLRGLGGGTDERAVAFLIAVARSGSRQLAEVAIETLGETRAQAAAQGLEELANTSDDK